MGRWFVVGAAASVSLAALASAAACRTFEAEETSSPADGSAEDVTNGESRDATAEASSSATRCPAPAFGDGCTPEECPKRPLYAPPLGTLEFPFGIATDSDHVFWVTQIITDGDASAPYNGQSEARIMRVDRAGASGPARATELARGQLGARAIAVAGSWVYWSTASKGSVQFGELLRVRADCTSAACAPESLGRLPIRVAVRLHFSGDTTLFALDDQGGVVRVVLTTPPLISPVLATKGVYADLATTDTEAFASSAFDGVISKIETKDNGAVSGLPRLPRGIDGGNPGPAFLATDCEDLYGLRVERTPDGGLVHGLWKASTDAGAFTRTRGLNLLQVYDIDADAKYLYFGSADGWGLFALSKTAPDASLLTVSKAHVWSLAVDDRGLYWGDHNNATGGAIWMMDKPK